MTYSRAKVQGQWSVGSEDKLETDGQTDECDCITSHDANAVDKYAVRGHIIRQKRLQTNEDKCMSVVYLQTTRQQVDYTAGNHQLDCTYYNIYTHLVCFLSC